MRALVAELDDDEEVFESANVADVAELVHSVCGIELRDRQSSHLMRNLSFLPTHIAAVHGRSKFLSLPLLHASPKALLRDFVFGSSDEEHPSRIAELALRDTLSLKVATFLSRADQQGWQLRRAHALYAAGLFQLLLARLARCDAAAYDRAIEILSDVRAILFPFFCCVQFVVVIFF